MNNSIISENELRNIITKCRRDGLPKYFIVNLLLGRVTESINNIFTEQQINKEHLIERHFRKFGDLIQYKEIGGNWNDVGPIEISGVCRFVRMVFGKNRDKNTFLIELSGEHTWFVKNFETFAEANDCWSFLSTKPTIERNDIVELKFEQRTH